MDPNKEFIYRDKSKLSPRTIKILGRSMLYATLFLLVAQMIIFLFRDWAVYTLFTLLPAVILLQVALFTWVGLNSLELWILDGQLYWKKTLSFMNPKQVPLKDIKAASIEKDSSRGRIQPISVFLNMRNGKKTYIVFYDSSTQAYQRAVQIRDAIENRLPNISAVQRGREYIANENYREAVREFDYAISANPFDDSIYLFRGLAKGYKKDFQGALEDLNQAIVLNPNNGSAYMQRSFLYNQLGMWEEAWKDLEKHVELIPSVANHPNLLAYKKRLAQKTGRE